ncbi:MAG: hypothetical protein RLZZ65_569 [Bacteroidota bacterium]|jgi:BirA family biotin operon repressor/biotin-[acetyl-CoA-carboxylase] ligase
MTKLGSVILHLSVVDSTNNYAAKLIEGGVVENGSVIMADFQTAGKGQRGNTWQSVSQDNLLFSLAYQPENISLVQQIRLSWYTAIIWIKCLQRFGINASIKWPNDIYFGKEKLGGILIENQVQGAKISWSVIGCGINVNSAPDTYNAIAINQIASAKFKPTTVLQEFLDLFNGHLGLLYGDFESLKIEFEQQLFGLNKIHRFEDREAMQFEACILGVNERGQLALRKNDDEVLFFDIQELKLLL